MYFRLPTYKHFHFCNRLEDFSIINGLFFLGIVKLTKVALQRYTWASPQLINNECPRWWFQRFYIFTPNLGEMIQFDGPHIFQVGWFNHQLVTRCLNGSDSLELGFLSGCLMTSIPSGSVWAGDDVTSPHWQAVKLKMETHHLDGNPSFQDGNPSFQLGGTPNASQVDGPVEGIRRNLLSLPDGCFRVACFSDLLSGKVLILSIC